MVSLEMPGEELPDSKVKENLQKRMQRLFEENSSDACYQLKRFPGSHPISLAREHLSTAADYLVCEKSDGIRYLLYLPQILNIKGINECHGFLVDRKYRFWRITVLVPSTMLKGDSLYDVELVKDHYAVLRILVFDTLFSGGLCFMHNNYYERLQAAWTSLIYPVRESLIKSKKSIEIFLKDFFRPNEIDYLWNHVKPLLPHQCDGLIFTNVTGDYVIGTNINILKWKPSELNTLDFSIRLTNRDVFELCTLGRSYEVFSEMDVDEDPSLKDGEIVECYLIGEKWKIYKKRNDKDKPNSTDTAQRILKSIKDNIHIGELIESFKTVKKPKTH